MHLFQFGISWIFWPPGGATEKTLWLDDSVPYVFSNALKGYDGDYKGEWEEAFLISKRRMILKMKIVQMAELVVMFIESWLLCLFESWMLCLFESWMLCLLRVGCYIYSRVGCYVFWSNFTNQHLPSTFTRLPCWWHANRKVAGFCNFS